MLSVINDKKYITLKLFSFVLMIFAVFRYGIGSDYFGYNILYINLEPDFYKEIFLKSTREEIGFNLFAIIFKMFNLEFQQFIAFISIVNIYFLYKTAKKLSLNPTLSLTLYFAFFYLVWTFSALRQGLAISIGTYVLVNEISKPNRTRFLISIFLLSFIHISVVILIALNYLSKLNFSKNDLFRLILISMFISILPLGNIIAIQTWLPFYERIVPYLNPDYNFIIFDFQSLMRIGFLSLVFIYYDVIIKEKLVSKKIVDIYILGVCFYFIFKFSELTAARLMIYSRVFEMVIFVNILYSYRKAFNRFLYSCILVVIFVLILTKEMNTMSIQTGIVRDSEMFVPYTSIFNKDKYEFNNVYKDLVENSLQN